LGLQPSSEVADFVRLPDQEIDGSTQGPKELSTFQRTHESSARVIYNPARERVVSPAVVRF
jgi:hypothetical protein